MILRQGSAVVKAEELPAANQQASNRRVAPLAMIKSCTLIGVAGFLLLTLVEQLGLNLRLYLASGSDRLLLLLFSSINILVGAVVGFLTGVSIVLFSRMSGISENALSRLRLPRWLCSVSAVLFTAGVAAILLKQFSRVNGFVIGMIREF